MRNLSLVFLFVLAAGSLLFATDITLEGTVSIPQPGEDVWVANIGGEDYAFVNAADSGVRKIRISDGTEVACFVPPDGAVRDIWVKDTLLFVANHGFSDTILYILNTTTFTPIGKFQATGSGDHYFGEAITVSPDTQNVVFIAVERLTGTTRDVFLYVIDAKDPTAPRSAISDHCPSYPGNLTDFHTYRTAIKIGTNVSILDLAIAAREYKRVPYGARLSNSVCCYYQWLLCTEDTVDVWHIAALVANSDSAWISIYSYDYFHKDAYKKHPTGCGGGTVATEPAPFALKGDPYYSPITDPLQDRYTFSSAEAYQMWVGFHNGTEYAFVARGSSGLWILPLYIGISVDDDIRDPIISGYKASSADNYRDVHIYGDLIFLANYGNTSGEKLLSVLSAAALEDSVLEETAHYNGFFGEGIWGDSLKVYVVGDSL